MVFVSFLASSLGNGEELEREPDQARAEESGGRHPRHEAKYFGFAEHDLQDNEIV